jgi:hypothetical protein
MVLSQPGRIQLAKRILGGLLESDMVTLNRERGCNTPVFVKCQRKPCPGRPMIDPSLLSFEPPLEERAIFAGVVQETREIGLPCGAKRFCISRCSLRNISRMTSERVGLPRWSCAVREIFHLAASSSR